VGGNLSQPVTEEEEDACNILAQATASHCLHEEKENELCMHLCMQACGI